MHDLERKLLERLWPLWVEDHTTSVADVVALINERGAVADRPMWHLLDNPTAHATLIARAADAVHSEARAEIVDGETLEQLVLELAADALTFATWLKFEKRGT